MYVFWFFEFLFDTLMQPIRVGGEIISLVVEAAESVFNVFGVLPYWLYLPFNVLICIAVLFRVSQFIPTIGGAS